MSAFGRCAGFGPPTKAMLTSMDGQRLRSQSTCMLPALLGGCGLAWFLPTSLIGLPHNFLCGCSWSSTTTQCVTLGLLFWWSFVVSVVSCEWTGLL